jgi:poly(A) polymerase
MRPSTLRRWMGSETFALEMELHRLDCLASHGDLGHYEFLRRALAEYRSEPVLPEPWITGRDLLALGVPPGPELGRIKQEAYDAQLEGRFADRDKLLAWASTLRSER